jgi:hypothetical protein
MFSTIQNLNHYIRTIFGNSTILFGGDLWVVLVQRVGQGNGAGPLIWALVSTPVLNMLQAEDHGAFFKAALSGDVLSFVGYSFVDDTDLIVAFTNVFATFKEITAAMQASFTLWEGGIRATCGAIVPEKTHW